MHPALVIQIFALLAVGGLFLFTWFRLRSNHRHVAEICDQVRLSALLGALKPLTAAYEARTGKAPTESEMGEVVAWAVARLGPEPATVPRPEEAEPVKDLFD